MWPWRVRGRSWWDHVKTISPGTHTYTYTHTHTHTSSCQNYLTRYHTYTHIFTSLWDVCDSCLRHKSDMVSYEAAKMICSLPFEMGEIWVWCGWYECDMDDMSEIWMTWVWYGWHECDMSEIWVWYECDMSVIWVRYECDMSDIWVWYEWYMSEIWVWYECDMSEIWVWYEWYMSEMWMRYEWDMSLRWVRCGWYHLDPPSIAGDKEQALIPLQMLLLMDKPVMMFCGVKALR